MDGFWPSWVAEKHPDWRVWSLDYPAQRSQWRGDSMSLLDAADDVLDCLYHKKIGDRPLVFVCHSLGGLLVKQVLRSSAERKDTSIKQICYATRGIAFFATPNTGAQLANVAGYALALLGPLGMAYRASEVLRELRANNAQIRNLNTWFRDQQLLRRYQSTIHVKAWYEMKGPFGLRIVDQTSADPGFAGVKILAAPGDHFSVCKPKEIDDRRILHVEELCQRVEMKNDLSINKTPNTIEADWKETTAKTGAAANHRSSPTSKVVGISKRNKSIKLSQSSMMFIYDAGALQWCQALLKQCGRINYCGELSVFEIQHKDVDLQARSSFRPAFNRAQTAVIFLSDSMLKTKFWQSADFERMVHERTEYTFKMVGIVVDRCPIEDQRMAILQLLPVDKSGLVMPLTEVFSPERYLALIARELIA